MTVRLLRDFDTILTSASKSAMIELFRTLKRYSNSLVLVGGWVPYFLLKESMARKGVEHVGSIDIDVVINPAEIGDDEYRTIVESICDVGWRPVEGKTFSYERSVQSIDGGKRDITVDFLAPESKDSGRRHRHRAVQTDLKARTMRGAEIALTHNTNCNYSAFWQMSVNRQYL